MRQRFRKIERLAAHADFTRCYRQGKRFRTPLFTLYAYRQGQGIARLGLAVGKSVGNAVVRNRVKRRLREIFRRHKALLPAGYDLCIRAAPASASAGYEGLATAFGDAVVGLGPATLPPQQGHVQQG